VFGHVFLECWVLEKPILFTEHGVRQTIARGFTEDEAMKAISTGNRKKEGKTKFKATFRTKRGLLIATCAEYPDHILVVTVSRRRIR
jgi:hypothetical protein